MASFYFYDLETSGINPRSSRIMQFGGQRTDLDLKPLGKPDNILIKLTPDVLPDPEAVLVHGITPQKTQAEGITEAQFAEFFTEQVSTKDTIVVGFNNVRFDDEFIRFLLWRNFTDAYEWSWKNGCSRWDLLDVVRMTRALRPDGIKWPFGSDGQASNKLELLSSLNQLEHSLSHDALSDVKASLAVARMIRSKQPKLFDYLFNLRDKNKVEALVGKAEPLIYTSGRYPSEFEKTTIAVSLGARRDRPGALMYNLRVDPTPYLIMSPPELAKAWLYRPSRITQAGGVQGAQRVQRTEMYKDGTSKEQTQPATKQRGPHEERILRGVESAASGGKVAGPEGKQAGAVGDAGPYFPVKILSYNKCPAIAPPAVLDPGSTNRLKLDIKLVNTNLGKLQKAKDFAEKLNAALAVMYPSAQPELVIDQQKVDEQLYEGFVNGIDKTKMRVVRAADSDELNNLELEFNDKRLKALFPLYKARNFPETLNHEEQVWWQGFKANRLQGGGPASPAAKYFARIKELFKQPGLGKDRQYLLEELKLYGKSILPQAK